MRIRLWLTTTTVGAAAAVAAVAAGPAAMSAPLGHLHPSTLTASHAATITYGGSTTLHTTLTDQTTGQPIDGAKVKLLARANSAGYSEVASATTDSDGVGEAKVSPKVNTTYKWTYDGDDVHHRATSLVSTVTVTQIVHAALAKRSVKRGKTAEVYGTVKPNGDGKTVGLERRAAHHWKVLATARLQLQKLPNGKRKIGYILPFTAKPKGTLVLRVFSDTTRQTAGGISRHLKLTVT
jgi:5-hydroxyisourate hydrolase-like protein (transthyretin family)